MLCLEEAKKVRKKVKGLSKVDAVVVFLSRQGKTGFEIAGIRFSKCLLE